MEELAPVSGRQKLELPLLIRSSLVAASGILAFAAVGCSASASRGATADGTAASTVDAAPTYLALGDSIAFGEDGWLPWTDPSTHAGAEIRANPAQFVGYPAFVALARSGDTADVTNLG